MSIQRLQVTRRTAHRICMKYLALLLLSQHISQAVGEHLMMVRAETEQGLAMELRLTGATSVVPWQAEEPEQATITSPQKTDGDEEEVTVPHKLPALRFSGARSAAGSDRYIS